MNKNSDNSNNEKESEYTNANVSSYLSDFFSNKIKEKIFLGISQNGTRDTIFRLQVKNKKKNQ
jgi:hypothetical protein